MVLATEITSIYAPRIVRSGQSQVGEQRHVLDHHGDICYESMLMWEIMQLHETLPYLTPPPPQRKINRFTDNFPFCTHNINKD